LYYEFDFLVLRKNIAMQQSNLLLCEIFFQFFERFKRWVLRLMSKSFNHI